MTTPVIGRRIGILIRQLPNAFSTASGDRGHSDPLLISRFSSRNSHPRRCTNQATTFHPSPETCKPQNNCCIRSSLLLSPPSRLHRPRISPYLTSIRTKPRPRRWPREILSFAPPPNPPYPPRPIRAPPLKSSQTPCLQPGTGRPEQYSAAHLRPTTSPSSSPWGKASPSGSWERRQSMA